MSRNTSLEHLQSCWQSTVVHARPQGGEIRLYVVTACRPHGWVGLRMYIVYMQASGCVEDGENH
jgi:hypothetical protein